MVTEEEKQGIAHHLFDIKEAGSGVQYYFRPENSGCTNRRYP